MPKQVQLRKGTTTDHTTFTGAEGEVTVDITKKTAVVHDGTTAGGIPLVRSSGDSMGNVAFNRLASSIMGPGSGSGHFLQDTDNHSFIKLQVLGGTVSPKLRGLTDGTDGRFLIIYVPDNATGFDILNEQSTTTAAERIITMTGATINVTSGAVMQFIYDGDASRWILVSIQT
jgi:hypothetical protein